MENILRTDVPYMMVHAPTSSSGAGVHIFLDRPRAEGLVVILLAGFLSIAPRRTRYPFPPWINRNTPPAGVKLHTLAMRGEHIYHL